LLFIIPNKQKSNLKLFIVVANKILFEVVFVVGLKIMRDYSVNIKCFPIYKWKKY